MLKVEPLEPNSVAAYRDGNPPVNPGLPLLLGMENPADGALAAEPPSFAQRGPRILSREQMIPGDTSSRAFSLPFTSHPSESTLQIPPAVHVPHFNASNLFELLRGFPVHDPSSQDYILAQLSSGTTEANCSHDTKQSMPSNEEAPIKIETHDVLGPNSHDPQLFYDHPSHTDQPQPLRGCGLTARWKVEEECATFYPPIASQPSLNHPPCCPHEDYLVYVMDPVRLNQGADQRLTPANATGTSLWTYEDLCLNSDDPFSEFPAVDSAAAEPNLHYWSCV
jgi:hypothetical protein